MLANSLCTLRIGFLCSTLLPIAHPVFPCCTQSSYLVLSLPNLHPVFLFYTPLSAFLLVHGMPCTLCLDNQGLRYGVRKPCLPLSLFDDPPFSLLLQADPHLFFLVSND